MALPSTDAYDYGNNADIELHWAQKCYEHAEVYFNLLCAVNDATDLRLTRHDDLIYQRFEEEFSGLNIQCIEEDELKKKLAKEKWRKFCEEFREVDDYNFGTLLRLDCEKEYSEKNSTLVPKVQFLAIEIARNRQGLNNGLGRKVHINKSDRTES